MCSADDGGHVGGWGQSGRRGTDASGDPGARRERCCWGDGLLPPIGRREPLTENSRGKATSWAGLESGPCPPPGQHARGGETDVSVLRPFPTFVRAPVRW